MLSSYATHDQLQSYAAAKDVDLASDDASIQDGALVRASLALDAMYGSRFPGSPASYSQLSAWPRSGATWPDGTEISGIPDQIVAATCELAIAELQTPGSLTPIITPGKVKTRARVEGAVDVSYAAAASDAVGSMIPVLSAVAALLINLVGSRSYKPGVAIV